MTGGHETGEGRDMIVKELGHRLRGAAAEEQPQPRHPLPADRFMPVAPERRGSGRGRRGDERRRRLLQIAVAILAVGLQMSAFRPFVPGVDEDDLPFRRLFAPHPIDRPPEPEAVPFR